MTVSAEPLLSRLDKVRKNGHGWMACCPAHTDRNQSLSVTEKDGKVLLYCFAGCQTIDVLTAVGMGWADIMPPRNWPASPEERRKDRRAIREYGWACALELLAFEAKVVAFGSQQLARWQCLSEEDDARLALAVDRIDHASLVLLQKETWKPAYMHKEDGA